MIYKSKVSIEDHEKTTCKEKTFKEKLKILFDIEDYVYNLYSTFEDPINKKINKKDREEIILESHKIGYELANKILLKSPDKSVTDHIKENDIKLTIEEKQENTNLVHFGTYESGGLITLFKGNILKSMPLLRKEEINDISIDEITEIILAHELFHYFEDKYPDMYTNEKEIKLWKLGPYIHYSKLICPSEIAAMSFTKKLLNLDFNPKSINYLLYSSVNKQIGEDFYKKITKLNKKII